MRAIPVAAAVFILSVLVIGGALFFEFVIGLVPCELCLLQRWPWYAAIVLSGLVLALAPARGWTVRPRCSSPCCSWSRPGSPSIMSASSSTSSPDQPPAPRRHWPANRPPSC
ncbi:MAG: disulfide bond formation protein B [Aliidongia sp.]